MYNFKKSLAVVCSLTVMASSSVTAFATAPSSEAGTGNVLAYSLESVLVPTAIKVALNPQELAVTKKGTGDDADISTSQIVSFNYGIANLSTADKDVSVTFNISGTRNSEKEAITFVDTATEATYGTGDTNAKEGELKMYVAIVGSKAAPKDNSETPAAFEVTPVAGGANTINATNAALADVTMEAASGGAAVFVADETAYATSKIAFKLGKTKYAVQDNESIDWTTTQAQLASKMEYDTLGDVTGFTFTGAMNKAADWTKADVSSLTFTPIYSVTDVTGDEVATTDGGYKQIDVAAPTPAEPTVLTTTYDATGAQFKIAMPSGVTISAVSDITNFKVNDTAITVDKTLNSTGDVIKFTRANLKTAMQAVSAWPANATDDLVITFTVDGTDYTTTIARQ